MPLLLLLWFSVFLEKWWKKNEDKSVVNIVEFRLVFFFVFSLFFPILGYWFSAVNSFSGHNRNWKSNLERNEEYLVVLWLRYWYRIIRNSIWIFDEWINNRILKWALNVDKIHLNNDSNNFAKWITIWIRKKTKPPFIKQRITLMYECFNISWNVRSEQLWCDKRF